MQIPYFWDFVIFDDAISIFEDRIFIQRLFYATLDTLPLFLFPFGAYTAIALILLNNIFFNKDVDKDKRKNYKFILIFCTVIIFLSFFIFIGITFYASNRIPSLLKEMKELL